MTGWIICSLIGSLSVFGLYEYARTGDISQWMFISYALLGRNAYAFSLAWITFACATGHGGQIFTLFKVHSNSDKYQSAGHQKFWHLSVFCSYPSHFSYKNHLGPYSQEKGKRSFSRKSNSIGQSNSTDQSD